MASRPAARLRAIRELADAGLLDGVTTNPSLLAKEPGDYRENLKKICAIVQGPVSGEVIEVNEEVVAEPEKVNEDPYGAGWLVRIRISDPAEAEALLDVAAYRELLASL